MNVGKHVQFYEGGVVDPFYYKNKVDDCNILQLRQLLDMLQHLHNYLQLLQFDIQAPGRGQGNAWNGCYSNNTTIPGITVTYLQFIKNHEFSFKFLCRFAWLQQSSSGTSIGRSATWINLAEDSKIAGCRHFSWHLNSGKSGHSVVTCTWAWRCDQISFHPSHPFHSVGPFVRPSGYVSVRVHPSGSVRRCFHSPGDVRPSVRPSIPNSWSRRIDDSVHLTLLLSPYCFHSYIFYYSTFTPLLYIVHLASFLTVSFGFRRLLCSASPFSPYGRRAFS